MIGKSFDVQESTAARMHGRCKIPTGPCSNLASRFAHAKLERHCRLVPVDDVDPADAYLHGTLVRAHKIK
jgi:hypothetical protein